MQRSTPQGWRHVAEIPPRFRSDWHPHNSWCHEEILPHFWSSADPFWSIKRRESWLVFFLFLSISKCLHRCVFLKTKYSVKGLLPGGKPFIESVWMSITGKVILSMFPLSHSDQRVSVCPRHSLCRRCVCSDALLRWGHLHHVWLRLPSQGASRWRLEVGRLQWRCRVWSAGVQGVCRCQREPSRCSVCHEPAQQRGWPNGKYSRHAKFIKKSLPRKCHFYPNQVCKWSWGCKKNNQFEKQPLAASTPV